jgi:plasmid stability protein
MQLTVRNLPPKVHATLTERARSRHQSLNSYVLEILEREADSVDVKKILERAKALPPVSFTTDDVVAAIREMRDA